MSVAVPIAPRFLAFLALAASLTLDLLFFFGARGSSASFTFFAFDRGAGGGHEPPLTASARTGRGRAAAATPAKAASMRARARAMAPLLLRVAQCAPRGTEWLQACAATQAYGQQAKCASSLLRFITDFPRFEACLQNAAPTHQPQVEGLLASVLLPLARLLTVA